MNEKQLKIKSTIEQKSKSVNNNIEVLSCGERVTFPATFKCLDCGKEDSVSEGRALYTLSKLKKCSCKKSKIKRKSSPRKPKPKDILLKEREKKVKLMKSKIESKAKLAGNNILVLECDTISNKPVKFKCLDCGKVDSTSQARSLYKINTRLTIPKPYKQCTCRYTLSSEELKKNTKDYIENRCRKDGINIEIIECGEVVNDPCIFKCLDCGKDDNYSSSGRALYKLSEYNTQLKKCSCKTHLISVDKYELEDRCHNVGNNFKLLEYNGTKNPAVAECLDCGNIISVSVAKQLFEINSVTSFNTIRCDCRQKYELLNKYKNLLIEENLHYEYEILDYFKSGEALPNGKTVTYPSIKVRHYYCNHTYIVGVSSFFIQKDRCRNCCKSYEKSLAYHIEVELDEDINDFWDWSKNPKAPCFISKSSMTPIYIKCKLNSNHSSYKTTPATFSIGCRCPRCPQAKTEHLVEELLKKHYKNFEIIRQKKYKDLRGLGNGLLSYDFYIPKLNLFIEVCGKQHYEYIPKYFHKKGYHQFERQLEHDYKKVLYATEKLNARIVVIPYWEFDRVEEFMKEIHLI